MKIHTQAHTQTDVRWLAVRVFKSLYILRIFFYFNGISAVVRVFGFVFGIVLFVFIAFICLLAKKFALSIF